MKNYYLTFFLSCLSFLSCKSQTGELSAAGNLKSVSLAPIPFDTTAKTIHVFVALCDNKFQGIVPVPAKIGNGQDQDNNLYWGCGFGVRTFFEKSKEWKLIRKQKLDSIKLERLVFKHVKENYFLIADAFNGKNIEQCTKDFLNSCAGQLKDTLQIKNTTIGIAGNAKLLAYIGHNGLMDFQLNEPFINEDGKSRDVIILACYSKNFFAPHLKTAKVKPLVWSTGLMSPEAYTLHDAISGYINKETNEDILLRAVKAYSK